MNGRCERCGHNARRRRFCKPCERSVNHHRDGYLVSASGILAASGPLGVEWAQLEHWRAAVGLPEDVAREAIRGISNEWMTRYAAFAVSDGVITDEEMSVFRRAAILLNAEPSLVEKLANQLRRIQTLVRVREGDLPRASTEDLHLPTDEHCYLNIPATRLRYLKSGTRQMHGQLVLTNRKLRFSALEGGGEVALSKLLNVGHAQVCNLSIEATTNSLSGEYLVGDAEWAAAVIDTTLRIDRRVILPGATRRSPIPQHVKSEVWQRDHGRCVQCSASDYLEFDHIIPRSKGGADSVANVQLLCRRCNLRKSDRI